MRITITLYSDLKESKVVNVPAPAIIGKAMGTTEILFIEVPPDLKISLLSVISKPTKNITIEPANENEATSIPITLRSSLPAKRKTIIMKPETSVAYFASIWPSLDLISRITGIEPKTSIIANSMRDTDTISFKSIDIINY